MTILVLTEKFSVASDFARALGVRKKGEGYFENTDYVITWAVGHLVELCEPEDYDPMLKKWRLDTLPVMPDRFIYKPIRKSIKQFVIIKNLIEKRDISQIIIATDAGREGEVIARTILLEAGFTDKTRIKRFWTSQALVPEVVRENMGLLKPLADYDRLWRAGYYRQVSDWLVGMNLTRVLTVRLKDLFSVGRVQTAVLALLVDRKTERDSFVPEAYWKIRTIFSNEKGRWKGTWFKGKDSRLKVKEDFESLFQKLNDASPSGLVKSVEKQKKKELPPLLFSLTDLQQEANKRFGFSAKKTLDIAQKLYQDKKCLSYPRTDSRVLGTKNLKLVQDIIGKLRVTYGEIFRKLSLNKISLSNKRVFNDEKLTDHHALIPFKSLPKGSSQDEDKLFDLVLRRFAAAFHPDCEFEQTLVVTEFSGETFRTKGRVNIVTGWRDVYNDFKKDSREGDLIPPLNRGDSAHVNKIIPEEKQTNPPPEYTDSLLLKDMTNPGRYVAENDIKKLFRGDVGVGTQSTRAQIIETLINRRYANRQKKYIIPTEKGVFLVENLRKTKCSKVLTSPEETARWEMALNRIALGEKTDMDFLSVIKDFVSASVDELKTVEFDSSDLKNTLESLLKIGRCPSCGADVVENFKAYGCSGKNATDKGCGFVIWKRIAKKKISPKMASNLLKYGKSGPFDGFVSKKNKRFSAHLKIENENSKCKVAFDFKNSGSVPKKNNTMEASHVYEKKMHVASPPIELICPICGGKIIEGKKGFGCSNWKTVNGGCSFVIWKNIHGRKLTERNIDDLLKGKTTRPYVLKITDSDKIKGRLRMERGGPGKFVVSVIPEGKANTDPRLDTVLSFA